MPTVGDIGPIGHKPPARRQLVSDRCSDRMHRCLPTKRDAMIERPRSLPVLKCFLSLVVVIDNLKSIII